jgi:DNA-binding transcriptional ArsR family regulator
LSRTQQMIDTLEAQCAELRERLAWLEAQLKEAQAQHEDDLAAVPARSLRRATARRASRRRAEARTRKLDTKATILEFLSKHPGSTAGEVAKGLDLTRASVSSRLTQLAKLGQIRKAERGYAAKPDERPMPRS